MKKTKHQNDKKSTRNIEYSKVSNKDNHKDVTPTNEEKKELLDLGTLEGIRRHHKKFDPAMDGSRFAVIGSDLGEL